MLPEPQREEGPKCFLCVKPSIVPEILDPQFGNLNPKNVFLFQRSSIITLPGFSVPVRDHPEKELRATFVALQAPGDRPLANMATSHSDGFPHKMQRVGKGEPRTGSPPGSDEPAGPKQNRCWLAFCLLSSVCL